MAREIIWSLPAIEDTEAIYAYLKRDSPLYANKLLDELIDRVSHLGEMPSVGRIVPEFDNHGLREIFVKQYRVIYQIELDRIIIHGLIHMARDFHAVWAKEKK